jgi:hypothetical protein
MNNYKERFFMEINQAIMSFSQSEKAKSAIIATSQAMELLAGLSAPEQMGAQRVIRMNLEMILQEIQLAKMCPKMTPGMRLKRPLKRRWS